MPDHLFEHKIVKAGTLARQQSKRHKFRCNILHQSYDMNYGVLEITMTMKSPWKHHITVMKLLQVEQMPSNTYYTLQAPLQDQMKIRHWFVCALFKLWSQSEDSDVERYCETDCKKSAPAFLRSFNMFAMSPSNFRPTQTKARRYFRKERIR